MGVLKGFIIEFWLVIRTNNSPVPHFQLYMYYI